MKRLFDIVGSLAAIVLLAPLWIPVVVILKLTGEHYVFYVQKRIGRGGVPFGLLKFATMLKNSPNMGPGNITMPNDARVLPFGKILRKTKINELPQLLNVLRGDMSIIGPRPLVPNQYDYYSRDVKETINRMRPGLSGVASIVFRDEEAMLAASVASPEDFYRQHIAPFKGELEVWYDSNRSVILDLKLIVLTMLAVLYPALNPRKFLRGLPNGPSRPDRQNDDEVRAIAPPRRVRRPWGPRCRQRKAVGPVGRERGLEAGDQPAALGGNAGGGSEQVIAVRRNPVTENAAESVPATPLPHKPR